MRNTWGFFVAGLMASLTSIMLFRDTKADTQLPKENSGLRVTVPEYSAVDGSIAAREKGLEKKEAELKEMQEALEAEKKVLETKIVDLEKVREEVKKYQDQNAQLADGILARLVKTYETMDPKKSSGVISVMEDSLAVELLLTMKEKKVAAVLQVMDPARAMQLSTLVSNRRPAGRAVPNGRLNQK